VPSVALLLRMFPKCFNTDTFWLYLGKSAAKNHKKIISKFFWCFSLLVFGFSFVKKQSFRKLREIEEFTSLKNCLPKFETFMKSLPFSIVSSCFPPTKANMHLKILNFRKMNWEQMYFVFVLLHFDLFYFHASFSPLLIVSFNPQVF